MAREAIAAPPHPSTSFTDADRSEMSTLRGKGQRTLVEANRLIDLLTKRMDALEAKAKLRP